ncbi:MAG: deoxyribose-phosphate aldolase [Syntrophotaleaceae bacterium]
MPTTVPEASADLARHLDHTLLKANATGEQIRKLCAEARHWGFASVCVPPRFVPLAVELLATSPVAVGTVIGFPLGYQTSDCKVFEARQAVAAGASELDMVIAVGRALEGQLDAVEQEMAAVVTAAGSARVKVIIECCYLPDELKVALTEAVIRAGADYVKTSTGFGSGGASLEDVRLLVAQAQGRIGVKAAGGIRDLAACRGFLAAGATRIGTSNGVAILGELQEESRRER